MMRKLEDTEFKGFSWRYDTSELIADGIVHGIGLAFGLIATTVLVFYATAWKTPAEVTAAYIYGSGLLLSIGVSFAYNIWPISRTKAILRRFDHGAIFIFIAATYTPFLVRGLADPVIAALFIGIWTTAAVGVAIKFFLPGKFDRLTILLYLGMGWAGLLAAGNLWPHLSTPSIVLMLVGGAIYSTGVIFHLWERLRFHNAIWHGFVVTAAIVHWVAVLTNTVLMA